MKLLKLTDSINYAVVDDEDYDRLSKFSWSLYCNSIGRCYKYERKVIYISLACEVMCQPNKLYDHKDRNPYNNQKINLRECNQQQNCFNKSKRKGTSSQYKGVCWHKRDRIWQARITLNQKKIHLGYFESEVEAALAYNKAATALFKDFASLNII